MPYLEVQKSEEDTNNATVEMPDITNTSIKEAKKILSNLGLDVTINSTSNEENINQDLTVSRQLPEAGVEVSEGAKVILYVEDKK